MRIRVHLILSILIFSGLLFFSFNFAFAQLAMPITNSAEIEAQVRLYFANSPDMVAIAQCESAFRQFRSDGSVLRGGTGGNYIGIFQISSGYDAAAKTMGFDIYSIEGNMGYAKYMFEQRGTVPWKGCVPKSAAVSPVVNLEPEPTSAPVVATTSTSTVINLSSALPSLPPTTYNLTTNLNFGMVSDQVLVLQKILNAMGFTIATSGAGSLGNETTKFGQLTLEAVKRFQCAKGIVCSGSAGETGYGRVGPLTRTQLLLAASKSGT